MAPISGAPAWLLVCFVLSLAGTWLARRHALRHDLLDLPGERRSHAVATPRGGGIGIVLALLLALVLATIHGAGHGVAMALPALGLLLVAGIGWFDDHRALSPWSRLVVHAIAAALLAVVAYREDGHASSALVAFALALVLTNVWNFMDGIDGIATMQAIVVAGACALLGLDPLVHWLALATIAACLGFLPLNLVRARIFLGDVGSGALGYILAVVMTMTVLRSDPARISAWVLVLLPPSAFLVDTALTLGWRIVRGEHWWTAHVGHAYQRWTRRVGRHWPVMVAYTLWAVMASALALVIIHRSDALIMSAAIAWYLGGGISWLLALGTGRSGNNSQ